MSIALIAAAGLLALSVLFLVVLHPIISLGECLFSAGVSGGQKLAWSAATLLLGPIASLPYGVAATKSATLRRWTFGPILFAALSGATVVGIAISHPQTISQLRGQFWPESMLAQMECELDAELVSLDAHMLEIDAMHRELESRATDIGPNIGPNTGDFGQPPQSAFDEQAWSDSITDAFFEDSDQPARTTDEASIASPSDMDANGVIENHGHEMPSGSIQPGQDPGVPFSSPRVHSNPFVD